MALPAGAYYASDGQTVAQTACMIVHATASTKKQITEVARSITESTGRVCRDFIRLMAMFRGAED